MTTIRMYLNYRRKGFGIRTSIALVRDWLRRDRQFRGIR